MRRTLTLMSLVASALAGGVALSGCGAGGLDTSDVAQAAQTTQNAGTARVAFTAGVAGTTLHGSGFVDMKRRLAQLAMTTPQGTLREVYDGKVMYEQFPPSMRKGVLARKPWASVDITKVAKAQGIDLGALQSVSDPSNAVGQLRSLAQVKRVGTATVRGAKTTEFTAVVDLHKVAARAPAAQRAAAQHSVDTMIGILGRSTMPVKIWVDDAKRVRREQLSFTILGQTLSMSMDLFDFGVQHTITPPAAGQVTDLTKLVTQAQKQGGLGQTSQGGGSASP
jgi:hypothetical protein